MNIRKSEVEEIIGILLLEFERILEGIKKILLKFKVSDVNFILILIF